MLDMLTEGLALELIRSGGVQIRDVDGGEEPFLYSSGNSGPGYIDVKGRCAFPRWVEACASALAMKVVWQEAVPDVVTGNATGGMIASWEFNRQLSRLVRRDIPFFYLRGTRKVGGHQELLTGESSLVKPGKTATVGEELVNFAGTTSNAALILREEHGLVVNHGTSFLNYDHGKTRAALEEAGLTAIFLFTLDEVLDLGVREGLLDKKLVEKYREFLADTKAWMDARGIKRKEMG